MYKIFFTLTFFIFLLHSWLFAVPSQEITPLSPQAKELFWIETITLQNAQGKSYPLFIALPKHTQDKKAIFYTLDGNAFFSLLLNEIASKNEKPRALPLIVGIGHQSPLAFDRALRTYDYTPLLQGDMQKSFGGGGGIDVFLDFLIQEVKPFIHKKFGTPFKELLFGHSFGGLFVLHTLVTKPQSFSHYVCASPSLWWGEGSFLSLPLQLKHYPKMILFTQGSLESPKGQTTLDLKEIIKELQNNAPNPQNISFIEYKGQNHGSSVPYAMKSALDKLMH